jgi:hypothetical protein
MLWHHAAGKGDLKMAKVLVKAKVNYGSKDKVSGVRERERKKKRENKGVYYVSLSIYVIYVSFCVYSVFTCAHVF